MNSSTIAIAAICILGLILWIKWLQTLTTISTLNGQVNLTIGTLIAQLEQRMNLIPDTIRAAKEAVKVQYDFYMKVLEVRKGVHAQVSLADLADVPSDSLPLYLASINGSQRSISEGATTMDTSTYNELQRIFQDTEKDISAAKRHYWSAVTEYNSAVLCFPGSLISSFHGFKPMPQPRLSPELDRKPNYW